MKVFRKQSRRRNLEVSATLLTPERTRQAKRHQLPAGRTKVIPTGRTKETAGAKARNLYLLNSGKGNHEALATNVNGWILPQVQTTRKLLLLRSRAQPYSNLLAVEKMQQPRIQSRLTVSLNSGYCTEEESVYGLILSTMWHQGAP